MKYDEISEKLIVTRQHQDVDPSIITPPQPILASTNTHRSRCIFPIQLQCVCFIKLSC